MVTIAWHCVFKIMAKGASADCAHVLGLGVAQCTIAVFCFMHHCTSHFNSFHQAHQSARTFINPFSFYSGMNDSLFARHASCCWCCCYWGKCNCMPSRSSAYAGMIPMWFGVNVVRMLNCTHSIVVAVLEVCNHCIKLLDKWLLLGGCILVMCNAWKFQQGLVCWKDLCKIMWQQQQCHQTSSNSLVWWRLVCTRQNQLPKSKSLVLVSLICFITFQCECWMGRILAHLCIGNGLQCTAFQILTCSQTSLMPKCLLSGTLVTALSMLLHGICALWWCAHSTMSFSQNTICKCALISFSLNWMNAAKEMVPFWSPTISVPIEAP